MKPLSLVAAAFSMLMINNGCNRSPTTIDAEVGTVTIEIRKADSARVIEVENAATGSTLEQVMRSIDEVPMDIRGRGLTAFVNEIDGLATSQSEGWTYRIDDEYVGEGIGSVTLTPPTKVVWQFGAWEEMGP